MNLSSARIALEADGSVDVEVSIKASDLDRAAGVAVTDAQSGLVRADALGRAAAAIAAYVDAHAVVLGEGGAPCRPRAGAVSPDQDGVSVRTRWFCSGVAGRLRYRSTVLLDVAPDARQVVLIRSGGGMAQDLLNATRREILLSEGPSVGEILGRYVAAGAAYSFIGYQQIAFVVALLLWVRRVRPAVAILAAFALAHSVTLWLAASGALRLPRAVVAPAIVASVICVAVQNLLSRDVARRWRAAIALGPLHGFGFAAALQSFGLSPRARLAELAAFNAGVEIAQLEIGAVALALLLGLDRVLAVRARAPMAPTRSAVAVYALSGVLVALGGWWLSARPALPSG